MADKLLDVLLSIARTPEEYRDTRLTLQALALFAAPEKTPAVAEDQQSLFPEDPAPPLDTEKAAGGRDSLTDPEHEGYWATKCQEFSDDELYGERFDEMDPQTGFAHE